VEPGATPPMRGGLVDYWKELQKGLRNLVFLLPVRRFVAPCPLVRDAVPDPAIDRVNPVAQEDNRHEYNDRDEPDEQGILYEALPCLRRILVLLGVQPDPGIDKLNHLLPPVALFPRPVATPRTSRR
jgi:hypothetical protein